MRRLVAAAAAGVALIAGGAVVANETLLSSDSACSSTIAVGTSWDAAMRSLPAAGGTLCLAEGTHPAQIVRADPSKTGLVVFQGGRGAIVQGLRLGDPAGGSATPNVGPKRVEFRGFTVQGDLAAHLGTDDITLRDLDAGRIDLASVRNVRVLGGDYGPTNMAVSFVRATAGGPSDGVLFDGVTFRDNTITDPDKHSECLFLWDSRNVTVRNSTFQNCTDYGLFAKGDGMTGIVIENNFFDVPMPGNENTLACSPGCPRGGPSIRISDNGQPISGRIAYNSALGAIVVDAGNSFVVKANATNPANFVDAQTQDGTMDLHLRPGAPAIDAGDPTDFPATDIDGQARPQGAAPDAGADEFGASEPPPPTTTEPPPTTTDPPPTTTEPPPVCPGTTLTLRLVSQTAATITLGWDAVAGADGYRFSRSDQSKRPHTWDGSRTSVTFGKGAACYRVEALDVVVDGGFGGS